jgi:hypothetical protein
MFRETVGQRRHLHERARARRVGDDDGARSAREINRLENARAKIAVGVPQHKTQNFSPAFRAKLDIVSQHVDADRRLVIGVEFVEDAAARERRLAGANVPQQHDLRRNHRMPNSPS